MAEKTGPLNTRTVFLAGVLCAGLCAPTFAAKADAALSTSNYIDTNNLIMANENANTIDKSETVYVYTTAQGSVKNIKVTEWLKNTSAAAYVSDGSSLANIKTDDDDLSFTQDGENLIWVTGGKDVRYTGSTTAEPPISMRISYTLNGAPIAPDDLAGKAGHVAIRYDFENNARQTVAVDGSTQTVYTPFACITGVVLDNEKFSNITVENGKIMGDSNQTTVAGYAFPGLQESLNLSKSDADIPTYFIVEADTTEFTLDTTATMVTPSLLDSLNPDAIKSATLEQDLNDLSSAMKDLTNGSAELTAGLDTLATGASSLSGGVGQLAEQTKDLPASTRQLANGSHALVQGLSSSSQGIVAIVEGTGGLPGLKAAGDAAAALDPDPLIRVVNSLSQIKADVEAVKTPADNANTNANTAKQKAQEANDLLQGIDSSKLDAADKAKLNDAIAAVSAAQDAANKAASNASDAKANATKAVTAIDTADLPSTVVIQQQVGLIQGVLNGPHGTDGAIAGITAIGQGLGQLEAGALQLSAGLDQFADSTPALVSGIETLRNGSSSLADGVAASADGSSQITDGIKTLDENFVQRVISTYNNDIKGLSNRLKATVIAGKNYQSFTGLPANTSGDIKFIFETDAIKSR